MYFEKNGSNKCKKMRLLCIEICKTIYKSNSDFMNNVFQEKREIDHQEKNINYVLKLLNGVNLISDK